ncbi:hypothetical protein DV26_01200 [Amycolatopsis mediterranei]|uniref:Uncharacterized protein n=1 Tax=Amycolatopsis mediterranei (strain S699) TaxID=713604 RepID=A0A9R0P156_AMYMS|nr:hypothetical protein RAM_29425 [Amycolatopsis mediterranei S699]KDO12568.1 hypothetical protein DV26_01200 [Amycolatopsis mediterranei]KDU88652.1 hypothetical protein DV36_28995 [Amycolatopsis mediterranei]
MQGVTQLPGRGLVADEPGQDPVHPAPEVLLVPGEQRGNRDGIEQHDGPDVDAARFGDRAGPLGLA